MRILIVLALVFLAVPVQAQPSTATQTGGKSILGDVADVVFKEIEKRAIEEYYKHVPGARSEDDDKDGKGKHGKDKAKGHGRGNGLPPGLAKRAQLPPGLAKRGNHLPPGLMKGDLPPDLEHKLPPVTKGTERVIVDEDVLLIQKGTDIILDVLEGVLRG